MVEKEQGKVRLDNNANLYYSSLVIRSVSRQPRNLENVLGNSRGGKIVTTKIVRL